MPSDLLRTEPSADMRAMAQHCWQFFVAMRAEGFTETQALQLIGAMFAASAATRPPEDDGA